MRFRLAMLTAVWLFFFGTAKAQGVRPAWADGYFVELPNSYIEVVSGRAATFAAARANAAQQLAERRNLTTGRHVKVKIENGIITSEGGDEIVVKSRILDEYARQLPSDEWEVLLLAQTARHPQYDFEPVHVSDRYPFSARVLVPGMTQLHKGQTAKGLVIIGTEVAAAGGIIACEALRSQRWCLATSTHSVQQRRLYTSQANTFATVRNLCIAGAVAVYAWNIVDALTSRGARQVILGDASMGIGPAMSPYGAGLLLTFNF